jgi:phosphatidate cytidylyltransferase
MAVAEPGRKPDLGIRTVTAIAIVVVAGLALWLGDWWWRMFVIVVAIGVYAEWAMLSWRFARQVGSRMLWLIWGVVYIGIGAATLAWLRDGTDGIGLAGSAIGAVIATDVGAYFAGRTIGGPRIAPSISPSKTWAGLGGGVFLAAVWMIVFSNFYASDAPLEGAVIDLREPALMAVLGAMAAIIAQVGDFGESWMKRRAGVKDSGKLLPGHGGLFDRVDGLIAVMFAIGIVPTSILLFALVTGEPLLPSAQ